MTGQKILVADPTRSGQGEEPKIVAIEEPERLTQLVVSPDQRGQGARNMERAGPGSCGK